MSKRRVFTREFKGESVSLATRQELSFTEAARQLEIGQNPLRKWRVQLSAERSKAFAAKAVNVQIEELLKAPGVTEVSAKYRNGNRHVAHERYDFLRPTVVHCTSTEPATANTEYMFPFASVVKCEQKDMLSKIGGTLVASCLTKDPKWSQELLDATNIDRLNIGEVKTIQPHEGNIIDFLFRTRALQNTQPLSRFGDVL